MGEPRGDAGDSAVDLGNRDDRAWTALLADLSAGDRELLWTVGIALRHGNDGHPGEPSSGPGGTTQP